MMLRSSGFHGTNGYRQGPSMETYSLNADLNTFSKVQNDKPLVVSALSYEMSEYLTSKFQIPVRGFFKPLQNFYHVNYWASSNYELDVSKLVKKDVNLDLLIKLISKQTLLSSDHRYYVNDFESYPVAAFDSGELIVATPDFIRAILKQEYQNLDKPISIFRANPKNKRFFYASAPISELANLRGVYVAVSTLCVRSSFSSNGNFIESKNQVMKTWLYIPSDKCNLEEVLHTEELPNKDFTKELELLNACAYHIKYIDHLAPLPSYTSTVKTCLTGITFPEGFKFPEVKPISPIDNPALKYASLLTSNSQALTEYNSVVRSIKKAQEKRDEITNRLNQARTLLVESEADLQKRLIEIQLVKDKIASLEKQQLVLNEKSQTASATLTELMSIDVSTLLSKVFEQEVDFTVLNNIAESKGIYIQELVLGDKTTHKPIDPTKLGNIVLDPSQIYIYSIIFLYKHPIKIIADSHTSKPRTDRPIAGGPYLVKLDFSSSSPQMHIALPSPNAFYYYYPDFREAKLHPHASPLSINDKTKIGGIWAGTCTGEIQSHLSIFSGLGESPLNIAGLIMIVDSWMVNAVTADSYGRTWEYFPPWKDEYRYTNLDVSIEATLPSFTGVLYKEEKGNKAFICINTDAASHHLVLDGFYNEETKEFSYRRTFGQFGSFDQTGFKIVQQIRRNSFCDITIKQLQPAQAAETESNIVST